MAGVKLEFYVCLRLVCYKFKLIRPPVLICFLMSVAGLSPQGFDCRQMMDTEPGRCRRTVGKKWGIFFPRLAQYEKLFSELV